MVGKYDHVPPINILECLPMPPIPTALNLPFSTSGALDLASAPGRSTAPSSEPAALVATIQFISQSSASAWSVKYTVHNPSHSRLFVVASATSAVHTLPTRCLQCAVCSSQSSVQLIIVCSVHGRLLWTLCRDLRSLLLQGAAKPTIFNPSNCDRKN